MNDTLITCWSTGKEIGYVTDNGFKPLTTVGRCDDCGHYYAVEGLKTNKQPGLHILLTGYTCKECWEIPLENDNDSL